MKRSLVVALVLGMGHLALAATAAKTDCSALPAKIRPLADKCIAISTEAARGACFDSIGKQLNMTDDTEKACASVIEPLKAEYGAKEKAKYPNQASQVNGNNNGGNNNGNNSGSNGNNNSGGNMNGGNSNGNGPMNPTSTATNSGSKSGTQSGPTYGKLSAADCSAAIPTLTKAGNVCLAISNFNSRKACFDKISQGYQPDFFDQCNNALQPLKSSLMAQEKAKYPSQASALDGGGNNNNNNGGNGNGNGNGNMMPTSTATATGNGPKTGTASSSTATPKVDCSKLVGDTTTAANKCLAQSAQASRKKCFDAVGATIQKSPLHDSCGSAMDQLKTSVQAQEHAKYPSQPSALD